MSSLEQQPQQQDQELGELDASALNGYFRDDGAFIQVMPDGQQFIYLPDGQMGYLGADGSFNPLTMEFGDGGSVSGTATENIGGMPSAEASPDPQNTQFQQQQQQQQQAQPPQQQQQQQQYLVPSGASSSAATEAFNPSVAAAAAAAASGSATAPVPLTSNGLQQQQQQLAGGTTTSTATIAAPQTPVAQPQLYDASGGMPVNPMAPEQKPQVAPVEGLPPLFENELRHGYWANLTLEIFTSTGFKAYFLYLLWSCAVLVFFIGVNWMFGSLARVYHPPVEEDTDWQSVGFIGIFIVVSMLAATALTLIIQMTKEMWRLTCYDTVFWGVSFSDTVPPWKLYAVIMFLVTVLPFFWSLGLAADNHLSGIYFGQFFAYITQVIAMLIVAVTYVWFYFLALKQKYESWTNRAEDPADDEDETEAHIVMRRQQEWEEAVEEAREITQQRRQDAQDSGADPNAVEVEDPVNLRPWYRSPQVLFELGLDRSTVAWTVFVLVFGFVGVIVVATILATQGTQPSLSALWVVALVFFVAVLAIMVFVRKRGKQISIYTNLFFIFLFFVLVLVGCGHSPYSGMFGLFIVPLVLLQGMLLRKREYVLRKHEIVQFFGGTVEEVEADRDTYMIVARKCCAALLSHFVNVKNIFGARHPMVVAGDKEIRKQRASLFLDLRVLFYYWLIFWMMLCAVAAFSTTLPWPSISKSQSAVPETDNATTTPAPPNFNPQLQQDAVRGGLTLDGTPLPFCQYSAGLGKTVFDNVTNTSQTVGRPFSIYDLALFALLAESHGEAFDQDFAAWFRSPPGGGSTNSVNVLPNPSLASRVPPTNARQPEFLDFYDNLTGNHAVVVRAASNRGGTLLRNLDMMGDSMTLQLASIFAPTVTAWPLDDKRRYVAGLAAVKGFASSSNVTGDIDSYVAKVHDRGERAVIVGFGFNGVIATVAGSNVQAPVVTFNSPGASLLAAKYDIMDGSAAQARKHALHVRTSKSLIGMMDEDDDLGTTQIIECAGAGSSDFGCDDISLISQIIGDLCGDVPQKRVVYPKA